MKNHHPPPSPVGSGECCPFKDLKNMPIHVNANQAGKELREKTPTSGQNCWAVRAEKKAASLISIDHEQVRQTHGSFINFAEYCIEKLCCRK